MRRLSALLVLLIGVITGCYVGYYDPYYWGYPYYDPYYYSYDSYLVSGWSDSAAAATSTSTRSGQLALVDLEATAAAMAAGAHDAYTPVGCATATASGATVTYQFSNCRGEFGVGDFSGNAIVTLADDNGGIALSAKSTSLVVSGKAFVLDLSATTTDGGGQRIATIDSRSFSPDEVDSRQAQGTVTWQAGGDCLQVNGQGDSKRGDLTSRSTLTNYQLCNGRCPTQGNVAVDGPEGVFSAQFNGSSTVEVVGPNGDQKVYDLQCP